MVGRGSGWRSGLSGCLLCGLLLPAAMAQVRARPMAFAGVDADGMVLTLPAALQAMAAQAGVIFVGTVTSVRRLDGDGFSSAGVVEVCFAVEEAVAGVSGPSYTMREWGGLLPAGERGFAVGDRRLMLLHSPGMTGLSSPVGGFEGAIPVFGTGARVGVGSRVTTAAEVMLDLRWIAAKLLRPAMGTDGGTARVSSPGAARVSGRAETAESGDEGERQPVRLGTGAAQRTPVLVHGTVHGRAPWEDTGTGTVSEGQGAAVAEPVSAGAAASAVPLSSVLALLRQGTGSERLAR